MKAVWITPSASAMPRFRLSRSSTEPRWTSAAGLLDGSGGGIGAGEAEDLMARAEQFLDDGRADEAGRAGNENTHETSLHGWMETTYRSILIRVNE